MKNLIRELPFQPKHVILDGETANDCYKILFVDRDNSACSIIAEAILQRWGRKGFRAFSAGIRPASQVNPLMVDMLKVRSLWERSIQTKGCSEFFKPDAQCMDFIISVGQQRPIDLPAEWPGNPIIMHWRISEPIFDGKPAKIALAFTATFGELETRIKLFILVYERERANKVAA